MEAIITGDIINSGGHDVSEWLPTLKEYFNTLGGTPDVWEIYRGDEFQLHVPLIKALEVALHVKALMRSIKDLDVRMAIGIGDITYYGTSVSESNGPAYQRSGRTFDKLKEHHMSLNVATGNGVYDNTINLMLKLALDFMDTWSPVSAEIVAIALKNPDKSQQVIANELNIKQSAVSQRLKRARLDLVLEVLKFYEKTIQKFSHEHFY